MIDEEKSEKKLDDPYSLGMRLSIVLLTTLIAGIVGVIIYQFSESRTSTLDQGTEVATGDPSANDEGTTLEIIFGTIKDIAVEEDGTQVLLIDQLQYDGTIREVIVFYNKPEDAFDEAQEDLDSNALASEVATSASQFTPGMNVLINHALKITESSYQAVSVVKSTDSSTSQQ